MINQRTLIELTEYVPTRFERAFLSDEVAETIWRNYQSQVAVEFPSPKTQNQWQLTAQGWVGFLPVTPGLALALLPRTPLHNIFGMLEYAYSLQSFRIWDDLIGVASLAEFYERLALLLARRVLARCRKGIYHAYVPHTERLPYIRGQWHATEFGRKPWQSDTLCSYEEYTADVEENQIIVWTLQAILRSGLCTERSLATVQQAYRALQGSITVQPFKAEATLRRTYHRLNDDYAGLHALCRFFLDHTGPSHHAGEQTMMAFAVDMARLYERFVAEWLRAHLDPRWRVQPQERYTFGAEAGLAFTIDLVIYDRATNVVRAVLDTKYKTPASTPSTDDIAQVIAYAQAKGAPEAVLVYPGQIDKPIDVQIGTVRVRNATFALNRDLEQAGRQFLQTLGRERET